MELIFLCVATALLSWIASVWSSEGLLNLFVKTIMVLTALLGAIIVAANFINMGVI